MPARASDDIRKNSSDKRSCNVLVSDQCSSFQTSFSNKQKLILLPFLGWKNSFSNRTSGLYLSLYEPNIIYLLIRAILFSILQGPKENWRQLKVKKTFANLIVCSQHLCTRGHDVTWKTIILLQGNIFEEHKEFFCQDARKIDNYRVIWFLFWLCGSHGN